MVYDNRYRALLQNIMNGGAVNDHDASSSCTKIFGKRVNVSTIASVINDKLSPISMAMNPGICEMTGEKYWSIVGTTHDETLTVPSKYSVDQRAFLRAIYSAIINSDNGLISSTSCLNQLRNVDNNKLQMGDAQEFLKILLSEKWLHQDGNGLIYMGVRSIIEMMPYFRATYQENFHNCFLCKQILFHGYSCKDCDKIYHNYCLTAYTSRNRNDKCPHCKHDLDTSDIPEKVLASQRIRETEDQSMDTNDITASQPICSNSRSTKRARVN